RKTGLINEGTSVCFDMSNNNRKQTVSNYLKNNGESIDIRDVWSNWNKYPQELSYPLAGLFVTALIEGFGRDEFLSFFPNQTYENARAVFGEDLDVMIEEFEATYND
ncbi:MAG: hypothetical protein QNK35_17940, partial [Bacteroides sp.]|nr:hypothetical protein [Bacteroides sp.]